MSRWLWQLRWGVSGIIAFAAWFWVLFSKPDGWDPRLWFAIVSFAPFVPIAVMLIWGAIEHRRYRRKLMREEFTDQSAREPSSPAPPQRGVSPH